MPIIKSSFNKIKSIINRNPEITFLLFTILFLLISTQAYNGIKNEKKSNFYEILNNSFFKKTTNYYLNNLHMHFDFYMVFVCCLPKKKNNLNF